MHDIKQIRNNINFFKDSLKKRFLNIDVNNILNLDEKNRKLIQKKESLESEKKTISKSKDTSLFNKSKIISSAINILNKDQLLIKNKLDSILGSIPNIPCANVPEGKDESSNIEIAKSGTIPEFDFKVKTHYELGEKLDMLDFNLATKTSGSRFVFVKGKLALLERAISNFMLDIHTNINKIAPHTTFA